MLQRDPVPKLCSACENTRFEFMGRQGCPLGTSGGTCSASGRSALTSGRSILISGHGFTERYLQKPKLQVTEAQRSGKAHVQEKKVSTSKLSSHRKMQFTEAAGETGKSLRWKPTPLSSSRPLQTAEKNLASAIKVAFRLKFILSIGTDTIQPDLPNVMKQKDLNLFRNDTVNIYAFSQLS